MVNVDEAHDGAKKTDRSEHTISKISPLTDVIANLEIPCYLKPAIHCAKDVTVD